MIRPERSRDGSEEGDRYMGMPRPSDEDLEAGHEIMRKLIERMEGVLPSKRDRAEGIEEADRVPMWWESLPIDQIINVTVQGVVEPVDPTLPIHMQRVISIQRGTVTIDKIREYIVDNVDLLPNVDPADLNEQLSLGSIVMDLTPVECEILSACRDVKLIYPNEGERVLETLN